MRANFRVRPWIVAVMFVVSLTIITVVAVNISSSPHKYAPDHALRTADAFQPERARFDAGVEAVKAE